MAIVFRSLILFLTVLQSFTFGRYPPLPPFLEKNSNGKSVISLPLTVCIVHVQSKCQALSKHDSTTYDLASFQHTWVTITRREISKTHIRRQAVFHVTNYMGQTLWKETFSSANVSNFQQISKLWCLPFLINHSIFPFQIFISFKARRSAVGLALVKLTDSFSMNHQVTLLIYVLFLRHVFHHFIYWEWPPDSQASHFS